MKLGEEKGSMVSTPHINERTQKAQYRALIFDSGVGGLSVVGEIRKRLPDLALDYVADDAFRPYGEKSVEELSNRLPGLLAILENMTNPDVIVIACNTASVTALDDIRREVSAPVIGVVPAIKPAAALSRTQVIGVLGTPGTVRRQYVDSLIHRFAGDCRVILQGSVNLVDMAERKLAGETLDINAIRREIAPLFDGRDGAAIDAVVLACTHFPLLKDELKQAARQTVQWVDSGAAIANRVDVVLSSMEKRIRPQRINTAFLIGPQAGEARQNAFRSFGFEKVVGLMP